MVLFAHFNHVHFDILETFFIEQLHYAIVWNLNRAKLRAIAHPSQP